MACRLQMRELRGGAAAAPRSYCTSGDISALFMPPRIGDVFHECHSQRDVAEALATSSDAASLLRCTGATIADLLLYCTSQTFPC
jgi:hypothetical protein